MTRAESRTTTRSHRVHRPSPLVLVALAMAVLASRAMKALAAALLSGLAH